VRKCPEKNATSRDHRSSLCLWLTHPLMTFATSLTARVRTESTSPWNRFYAVIVASLACTLIAISARSAPSQIQLSSGEQIYKSACISCHGPEGKGVEHAIRGFEEPNTFPDLTRCDQTTSELNNDYRAVITNGGPYRGFSQIMPSFKEALTARQINMVIDYVRGFCRNKHWPPGELNLPLALNTEKAYPEDEVVLSTGGNATGQGAETSHVIYEQRFGLKNQLEVDVPLAFAQQNGNWYGGAGDTSIGIKHVMFAKLTSGEGLGSGTIFSLQGNVVAPTGNSKRGLGAGTTSFETFAEAGQLFRSNTFLQFQGGAILPADSNKAPQSTFWYTSIGQMIGQGHGLGRLWSPQFEILGSRDLVDRAKTEWDVAPQMQVTLSRRQHIRASGGVRIPVNDTTGRPVQVMFYILWDWQEGSFLKGW
jgi:mono/diheme cytochrome c family protein